MLTTQQDADAALEEVVRLISGTHLGQAEERLTAAIDALSPALFDGLEPRLRDVASMFFRKRRATILSRIDERSAIPRPAVSPVRLSDFVDDLREGLDDLGERHIFQWSTYYRDYLSEVIDRAIRLSNSPLYASDVNREVSDALRDHTISIFTKGYRHNQRLGVEDNAIQKSLNGLQRFLSLPLELYSEQASRLRPGARARGLRAVCSAIILGVIEGFAQTHFGGLTGSDMLSGNRRWWLHAVAFLREVDLRQVLAVLNRDDLLEGLEQTVIPTARALDRLSDTPEEDLFALPGFGSYDWHTERLEIALHTPFWVESTKYVTLHCYLSSASVSAGSLREAGARGVTAVIGAVPPDLMEWVSSQTGLRVNVATTFGGSARAEDVANRVLQILSIATARQRGTDGSTTPIGFNFARTFPLDDPAPPKFFHVYRSSVRELLRGLDTQSGVRLWCSVRRSGKTTACFDLGASSGGMEIVSQTCDPTDQQPASDLIYAEFVRALERKRQLPGDFLDNTVRNAAANPKAETFTLVLDEYETLFERMRLAAVRDPEVRYAVVQPMLNQMVSFSRSNLIVFMGQRPNAHFILMDQNQLSPYVKQDTFPLFAHNEFDPSSEFRDLVRKVLTENVGYDNSFVMSVYSETSGHPFLTVNVLVAFVDWLIERKRPIASLNFTLDDFSAFRKQKLTRRELSTSAEFAFFRRAVTHALSDEGRNSTPWLHAVYAVLRTLAQTGDESLSRPVGVVASVLAKMGESRAGRLSVDELVSSAAQANFFDLDGDILRPKIPLLARISGAVEVGADW